MARASRAVWTKRVRRWERSGLTAREFASRLQINPQTLKWWRWALASEQESGAAAASPVAAAQFVELVHSGDQVVRSPGDEAARAVGVPTGPSALVEVHLPSGVRVVVPAGVDAEAVGRLIAALERR
jgi:transposase